MNSLLEQILDDSERQIVKFKDQLSRFETDPMLLLQEVFVTNDRFLPIIIQRYGNEALLEIQKYWYDLLFPRFTEYIGVENLTLAYDETIYPAPIYFLWREDVLGVIHILDHVFEKIESEMIQKLKAQLSENRLQLENVKIQLEEKEPALENPFLLGGSNVLKLVDISIRRKKYDKKIRKDVHALQDDYLYLDKERIRLETSINFGRQQEVVREYMLDRIEQRILNLPGYHKLELGYEMPDNIEVKGGNIQND